MPSWFLPTYSFSDDAYRYALVHWHVEAPPPWEPVDAEADALHTHLADCLLTPDAAFDALPTWRQFMAHEVPAAVRHQPLHHVPDDALLPLLCQALTSAPSWRLVRRPRITAHGPGVSDNSDPASDVLDAPQASAPAPEPAWLTLAYRYQDGQPVAGAPFRVVFADGSTRSGTLDARGTAQLDGLPPERAREIVEVTFGEDARSWTPRDTPAEASNPYYHPDSPQTVLMGSVGLLASTDPALPLGRPVNHYDTAPADDDGVLAWLWDLLLGDFEEDPSTGQVVSGALITMIPVVDQIADVRDVAANLYHLSNETKRRDPWVWLALVATLAGLVPIIGSAVKGVLRLVLRGLKTGGGTTRDALFAVLRRLGRGDPEAFVRQHLDVAPLTREIQAAFADVLAKIRQLVEAVRASWIVPQRVQAGAARLLAQLRAIEQAAAEQLPRAVGRLRDEIDDTLGRGTSERQVTGTTNGRIEAIAVEAEPPKGRDVEAPTSKPRPSGLEEGAAPGTLGHRLPAEDLFAEGWPTLPASEAVNFTDAAPVTLQPGTRIYRVIEYPGASSGSYWSYDLPTSKAEWRAQYAVKGEWNADGLYVEHVVDTPVKVWSGSTASQKAAVDGYVLPGGGTQIWMPRGTLSPPSPKPTGW